ncbi:MAG TPA: magnesium/cobalt transporter CorA [Thermoanaerobaculia bacterium]|nr:magnesium/cobalt transporter CorA [Thermoanaerobaculia bacterium]
MARLGKRSKIIKRYHKPGTAPGTLRPLEEPGPGAEPLRVTVMDYGPQGLVEKAIDKVEDLAAFHKTPSVTWINVEGLNDLPFLEGLGKLFGFHPLALEDVLNCGQRPKVEDYGSYHFIVLKSLRLKPDGKDKDKEKDQDGLELEQISFFLAGNFVITLQQFHGDSFDAVRERIRRGKGQIRRMGPDYLAYALIDALVDEFFPVLESYGERIEALEDALVTDPTTETLHEIHQVKRDLLLLRRTAWPERDLLNSLLHEESDIIRPEVQVFLRDCYDHTIQVIDMIETYRDLAAGLLDVYLSSASNRLNEVMKVLTIISTIFIPLSFVASLYGMNFTHMPELDEPWGYPAVLAVMFVTGVSMVVYFKRKKWF